MTPPGADLIHVWHKCHACGMRPIVGRRFECQTCPAGPDTTLCEACHRGFTGGRIKHPPPEHQLESPGSSRHLFQAFEGKSPDQYLAWQAITQPYGDGPAVPDRLVVRPEFRVGLESFFGSQAFVVEAERPGRPLLLTALHVLDALIRHKRVDCSPGNKSYTGWELPGLVERVDLYDVFAPNWMIAELGSANSMLCLPEARVGEEEPYSQRDIAAFQIDPATTVSPAKLAAAPPAVGEPLWLAAAQGRGEKSRSLAAVVVERTEKTLVFRYPKSTTLPRYCSGAPLLNLRGEVVGINVGGGFFDGHAIGHANHVASIRRHLGWP